MEENKKILVDQAGYERQKEIIAELMDKLNKVNSGRQEAFNAGAGDGWDSPEYEEIQRQETMILADIKKEKEILNNMQIVDKSEDSDLIEIGDIILINMILAKDKVRSEKIKLVGTSGNFGAEVKEVSINSPLGAAVYHKKIGEVTNYSVNNKNIQVIITEKLKEDAKSLIKKIDPDKK